MTYTHRIVRPGVKKGTVFLESGKQISPPEDWAFLAAGDAAVTRKVKSKGPTWVVQVCKGRRKISKGIWAKAIHILQSQEEVEAKRATPEYERQRKRALARREAKQKAYIASFYAEVFGYLGFHPKYELEAKLLAHKVTQHATPVGSGTVARTERIPISQRAEAAVIAWLRHQTTAYDSMRIARIKGRRREVRRYLAAKSKEVLQVYREGREVSEGCPLKRILN